MWVARQCISGGWRWLTVEVGGRSVVARGDGGVPEVARTPSDGRGLGEDGDE